MAKKPVVLACILSILITGIALVLAWGFVTNFRFSNMNPPSYYTIQPDGELYFVKQEKGTIVISGPMIPYQSARVENVKGEPTRFSFYTSDRRELRGTISYDSAEIPAVGPNDQGFIHVPRHPQFALFDDLMSRPAWINQPLSPGK
jgi:hypothetical protein